jgi:hypothetical protein
LFLEILLGNWLLKIWFGKLVSACSWAMVVKLSVVLFFLREIFVLGKKKGGIENAS